MNIFNTKLFDSILRLIERLYYIILIGTLIVAFFNIYYNLGVVPIDSWDEARHGVSAYEMIKRNNYIVNTYAYNNDYWNLKPPISYLAIILGYKIAGFNPFGLRVFSGFAAMLTIIIIAIFSLHRYGKLASLISTIVLATTIPFITEHCARTGDADSLYVLFFTTGIISLALIEKNNKWIYGCGLSFALAFLTKSWHAGNIAVIGIVYLILTKILFKLKIKQIFWLTLSTCIPVLIWGIFRYMNDGVAFFKTMIEFDLKARTSTVLEGHIGGYFYYLESLQWSCFYWNLVFVATTMAYIVLIYRYIGDKKLFNHSLVIAIWIVIPFLLYTMAKTKISWYILPVYPAIALSIGATCSLLLKEKNRNLITQIVIVVMIAISIYKSEEIILSKILNPKPELNQELIKAIGNLPEYRGKRIYINHFEQSYWLSSELYADLTPIEGGAEGFLTDNTDKTLLFITKDDANILGNRKGSLNVLLENESAYIFTK
ncbi:glycosyltransferase family 39 protein [Clostridium sp.]|uniref:ArnT family glycosyltransferase n=1 Tax=Clostridium sp. TaxID=1506 RepID=UPI002840662E|nr:glycosyltransferase family 39 protein [Clostridium sp.]MDR3595682.1 glycosyltransferase family 39 protein [Clostridium sp.]